MNPFCAKHLKTNYNVTPYGDHGTERVKLEVQCPSGEARVHFY
jgi:hypothetical protein